MKTLTLIAAMDQARAIGIDGGLPWHLPEDLKHFKASTVGKTVLMGRRTFEEVGKALPRRQNLILSRSMTAAPPGCVLAATLTDALAMADSDEVMVIGGGEIYRATLRRANRLLITHVHTRVARADTWFPRISSKRWSGWTMSEQQPDPKHEHGFSIVEYLPRVVDDKVLCRTPAVGKKPTRIPVWKFELMRDRILAVVGGQKEPIAFKALPGLVDRKLAKAERASLGSLGWHVTTVKLELEVAGELRRAPGSGPQRLTTD
ncbi:MAG: dihydrofolate reductase [Pseudomonadota bacterium]